MMDRIGTTLMKVIAHDNGETKAITAHGEKRTPTSYLEQAMQHNQALEQAAAMVGKFQGNSRDTMNQAVDQGNRREADIHYHYLWWLRDLRESLAAIPVLAVGRPSTYVVTPHFLRRCLAALTADEKESMFYVSGAEHQDRLFLSDVVEFETDSRSVVSVHGNSESVFRAALDLGRSGQRPLAWFHSHPGGGQSSCTPSPTDIATQARLEFCGYPAIGAVFTRSGYVRFFSKEREFDIEIAGKGVERVQPHEHLYKISLD